MDTEIQERCLACGEFPDYCQGHGDLWACEDCRGWLKQHDWHTSRMSGTRTCSQCGLLPIDEDDIGTGCPAGAIHEPYCDHVKDRPWVTVVTIDDLDDEQYAVGDLWPFRTLEALEGLVQYLEMNDGGDETDAGGEFTPPDNDPDHAYPWGSADDTYEMGEYVLAINRDLHYAGLYRRKGGQ